MVIAPFKGKIVAKEFEVQNDFTENCVTFHQKIKGKLNILKLNRYILIMKMMQYYLHKLNFKKSIDSSPYNDV